MFYFLYQKRLEQPCPSPVLPPGLHLVFWRPTLRQPVHPCLRSRPFLAWSLFHFIRVFASRDYALLLVFRGGRLVHRTCLLPAHFRCPFQPAGDLQAAGIWTAPELRGQGLALAVLGEALRRCAGSGRTLWYLTREANDASIRLAEKAGFLRFGRVARRSVPGLRFLAWFRLEETFAPEDVRVPRTGLERG